MPTFHEPRLLTPDDHTGQDLVRLLARLDHLLERLDDAESEWADRLATVAPRYRPSARNMVHYWAIRQVDLRGLQTTLSGYGLSSLGRSEPNVEAAIRLLRAAVSAMLDKSWHPPEPAAVGVTRGRELLRRHAIELLGEAPEDRHTRIMVTLPSEAAGDPGFVTTLLERGMNVARINCAHDDAPKWRAMAERVRAASKATGLPCLVAMDLGGPKLRTGPLESAPGVVKLRPDRDSFGRVVAPARVRLTAAEHPEPVPEPGVAALPVAAAWLARRRDGDTISLSDTRGGKRRLAVSRSASGVYATTEKTTYLTTGTVLRVQEDATEVGALPEREQYLVLRQGDVLQVTRDCAPAAPGVSGPASIGCTLPEVFDNVRVGDRILFDDGKIAARIVAADHDAVAVRIDRASPKGSRLRAAKGINLPDTDLRVSALTARDIADLATVVDIADIVELSFVQDPSDVELLYRHLNRLGGDHLGVVLKIETRRAFERLPRLLLAAMRRPRVGVMIARGDLAVEVGYQRLAELQEEILWLCEAAHLPVIWATQVLDQLAQTGLPSRAEISDAAMGERAECVMLNKGPHIPEAVVVLDDILCRMSEHHDKKNALLRQLHSWTATDTAAIDDLSRQPQPSH